MCVVMCYTVTEIKHKKNLIEMAIGNVKNNDCFFYGNLTSNIEINVSLYRRLVLLFHQQIAALVITDRSKAVVLMWSLLAVLVSDFR